MTSAFGDPSHRHGHVSATPAAGLLVGVIGTGIMGADHARTLHRQVSGATVALSPTRTVRGPPQPPPSWAACAC